MSEDIIVEPEVRADRIMRSENARKNRKVVRDIVEKKSRKIETDNAKLLEKHENLMNSKKKKRKDYEST